MSDSNYNAVSFKTVLLWAFGVLVIGLALLVLLAFYDVVTSHGRAVAVSFLVALRVLLAFGVGYVGFMLYLSFEHRAIVNERLKLDNVQVLPAGSSGSGGVDVGLVCESYDKLKAAGVFSWSKLCIAVYGKKSGHYVTELRRVLVGQGYDIDSPSSHFERVE